MPLPRPFPLAPFLFPLLFLFCCAPREITYRETVESVRDGPFIGRAGSLESASTTRVGEDFDERVFLSDRERERKPPFAIRSHARELVFRARHGELSRKRQLAKEMAGSGDDGGGSGGQPATDSYFNIFTGPDFSRH